MKKFYTMLLALVCSMTMLQAQAWYVYDGSDIPNDLDGWSTSSNNPGPNFNESILSDPFIDGNMYLRYLNCDEWEDATESTNSRKYYRHDFTGSNQALTLVSRIKGESVDTLSGERIFQIEYNMGAGEVRDALTMVAEDSILKLERNGASVKVDANLLEWHIYRIVFDVADSTTNVYFDEDVTPVLTGKTTASSSSNYLRFGDGGSARVAGSVDWLIMDTTGVYAPGAGAAIPDSLSTETGPQVGYYPGAGLDLAFVSNTGLKDTLGYYADSMLVVALQDAGFNVILADEGYADLTADFKTKVEGTDVVVLGRTVGSSDLGNNKTYWSKLQLPIVSMNTYGNRSSKLGWLPSTSAKYAQLYGVQEVKVEMPEDAAFSSVTVPPADSVIEFTKDYISFLTFTPEELATLASSSKILATMVNGQMGYDYGRQLDPANIKDIDLSEFDGTPLMIRWEPLDSMYTGSGGVAARPFHYRTYIPGGDDHGAYMPTATDTAKVVGMDILTPTMKAIFVEECAYLAGLEGPSISDDYTLASLTVSAGGLDPAFTPGGTSYTVVVPEGTTAFNITATANDSKASVEGDGDFTLDGSDLTIKITVTSEAGTPNEINVLVKEDKEVADNNIPPGVNTIIDYLTGSDYDTYYLENGGVYESLDPIIIDRKVTLMAKDTVKLPALDNLPVIKNTYGITNVIELQDGADLTLFGIEVDGNGSAAQAITFLSDTVQNVIDGITIIRSRIHNTTGDLIGGSKKDSVIIKKAVFRNSFAYDAGAHGFYVKDVFAGDVSNDTYVFDNLTFWNLGQQLVWIQVWPETSSQAWIFDHMTGWKLSTDLGGGKELIGNSDGGGQYDITLTNTIFSNQLAVPTDECSLFFTTVNNNGDDNTFEIRNIVTHETQPIVERPGSGAITYENVLTADPLFSDVDQLDFTIGNDDYLTGGDDGTILGALYWHPDYVDDYADYGQSSSINRNKVELSVTVYPMPFETEISFDIVSNLAETATISVFDISGRSVNITTRELTQGLNTVTIDASDIQSGTYFYSISTNSQSATGQLIKVH